MSWVLSTEALLAYGWILGFVAIRTYYRAYKRRVHLPVINGDGIVGSWLGAIRYPKNARAVIQDGYDKYKNHAFQVATLSRWEVFICNPMMIKEYRNLDSNLMSANAVTDDLFQARYTLPGTEEGIHRIPIPVLAKSLTWQRMRAAAKDNDYFLEFYKEFLYAFSEEIHVADKGWTTIPCFSTAARIISRITAKLMVGRPLCRNQDLIDLFTQYGNVVPTSGWFIRKFPGFLKPLAARMCSAPRVVRRLEVLMSEVVRHRRENRPKIPNDLVDWMMKWVEENAPQEYGDDDITAQLVVQVFGAIHTTTQVLVHCLFEISAREEYIQPLRQEIDDCVKRYGGWNKESLEAMKKLDSFTRECQRYNPLDSGSLARRVAQDFTFSNGLRIPAGTFIFAPNAPVLWDQENYPKPEIFDGFRHYTLRQQVDSDDNKHSFTSPSLNNLQFGDGRHACPGRFMAADEIRLVLAHTISNYDIAIKDHKPRPANTTFTKILFPDMKAEIMLRRHLV